MSSASTKSQKLQTLLVNATEQFLYHYLVTVVSRFWKNYLFNHEEKQLRRNSGDFYDSLWSRIFISIDSKIRTGTMKVRKFGCWLLGLSHFLTCDWWWKNRPKSKSGFIGNHRIWSTFTGAIQFFCPPSSFFRNATTRWTGRFPNVACFHEILTKCGF